MASGATAVLEISDDLTISGLLGIRCSNVLLSLCLFYSLYHCEYMIQ